MEKNKRIKVEFIESYIHDRDGGDYIWNDNHGELIRCMKCNNYMTDGYEAGCGFCAYHQSVVEDNDYCSYAEKREI